MVTLTQMDGFTEKKWFIYLGDHHEGPFSLEEIQAKMGQGQFTPTNFVWAEGMSDWKMMTEVEAFGSILNPSAPPAPPEMPPQLLSSGPELSPMLSAAGPSSGFSAITLDTGSFAAPIRQAASAPAPILEATGPSLMSEADMSPPPPMEIELTQTGISATDEINRPDVMSEPETKRALAGQMVKMGMLLLFVAGIGIAYNEGYLNTLFNSQSVKSAVGMVSNMAEPLLTTLGISPIPKLTDVDADDFEQLKTAAKGKIDQAGPQIAVALSKADPLNPTFYVGSNLPDGTILDLYIEGIPDSLLNQLSFTAKTQVTITKKFAKSTAVQFAPGAQAFVRGQYMLFVADPETQPANVKPILAKMQAINPQTAPTSVPHGIRVLAAKTYFLGGQKDSTYTARLQEFHAKLQAKAQQELSELKQIMATYDSQLTETNQKFSGLKKGKRLTPGQKKAWETFHAQWTGLNQQLSQTFANLTPELLQNNYFYGSMYKMSQQVGEKLSALHEMQSSYFAGTVTDPKAFEIQQGEANAIAHSSIEELKTKITQIENTAPTPNGLPKRDGI